MLTRKVSIQFCSLLVQKLSQREWDWMKMLKPMDPPPAMVTTSILKRRGDTAALTLLQDTGV
ncbi:hypothetical protein EAN88_29760 [Klebsiella pneumoniae]|nr:hypothetical protein EAN88_29760 [Klebsiella pneumoniae]